MSNLPLDENAVRKVVEEVMKNLGRTTAAPAPTPASQATPAPTASNCGCSASGKDGIFEDAADAAKAAQCAYEQLRKQGMAARMKVVEIVKTLCTQNAVPWGNEEFEETKIGRREHKPEKLRLVKLVPGCEWLSPLGMSGDHGITMEEYTPFGVVGAILPMTHSIPTLAGNVVNIVAAGNAVVFNPHPGGAGSAVTATRAFNQAIERELGIRNLICTIAKPSLDSFDALCKAPEIGILCITGGPAVVNAAMKSGKRAICAGPGNPPVVVDETADIDRAARSIVQGAAFDNNLLCIAEKEVFVVDAVYGKFMQAMQRHKAVLLNGSQADKLTQELFTFKDKGAGCSHPVLNRALVGKSAEDLAAICGASTPKGTELLIAETDAEHPFVIEEQMTSILPIVRVPSVEAGIEAAKIAEHNYKHSSMIHSRNVDNMTAMARALDTTIFVKNGPCVAGLGLGGEGYISYSIATTTGEGITTPKTFTRTRRCILVDALRIH